MPRKTFVAGEVLAAADVNEFLADQAVMTFAGTAARGSAIASPVEGMVTYLEDDDQLEVYGGTAVGWSSASNFLFGTAVPSDGQVVTYSTAVSGYVPADASGAIVQVVRASDSTNRSTTSTSFVDVTGMSVSITPNSASNSIIVIGAVSVTASGGANEIAWLDLTDSADSTIISTGSNNYVGSIGANNIYHYVSLFGYDSPATTSSVTYKMRFKALSGATVTIQNGDGYTGQMYAIEVAG